MSAHDEHILIVAGADGGKSTFLCGLYHAAQKSEKYDTQGWWPVSGDEEELEDKIFERMHESHLFPLQTNEPTVIRMQIESAGSGAGVTLDVIDMPGEQQHELASELMTDIDEGNLSEREIKRKYEEETESETSEEDLSIADKMKQEGTSLNPDKGEYETLYRYQYITSSRVLFLLNLHKVLTMGRGNQDDEDEEKRGLAYNAGNLQQVAENKALTALVVSALDTLGYEPEEVRDTQQEDESTWIETIKEIWVGEINSSFSSRLANSVGSQIEHKAQAAAIIEQAHANPYVDLFGVSVPARDSMKGKHLKADGSRGFQTKGFEDVIDWLMGRR